MNPIIAREVRSRWRGRRAFGMLLLYAVLLSLGIALAYSEALPDAARSGLARRGSSWRTAEIGHGIFSSLAWMQALGWMLLAPTLTASTIAGEREHGLLEGLQLSPLTGAQIVNGKLASALFFILLMMLAALPVVAICFLLGGVSPGEFALTAALHAATATACATVGLFFSAWSRRAATALRATFVTLVIWGVSSLICFFAVPSRGVSIMALLFHLFGKTNPITAVYSVGDPMVAGPGFSGASAAPSSSFVGEFVNIVAAAPPWAVSLGFQVLLVPVLLWWSARALRRPFAEQYWIERKRTARSDADNAMPARAANGAAINSAAAGAANSARPGDQRRGAGTAGSGDDAWWEIPVGRLFHFANPVLQREARGKFRMRRVPPWVIFFEAALGLFVAYFYCWAMWSALTKPNTREYIWWTLAFIGLFVVMLSSATMGAGAFSRERESGTFEPLLLSTLPSRDIIWGKIAAPLLACAVFTLPFVPLLALCVRSVRALGYGRDGIALTQAVATLGVLAATTWCYTAWGMFISWHCRRTTVAAGWTLGTLFLANVFMPIFFLRTNTGFLAFYQPVGAMMQVASSDAGSVSGALTAMATLFGAGCVFLLFLHEAMQHRAREQDANRQNYPPQR